MLKTFHASIFFTLIFCLPLFALEIPPPPQSYVTDNANLLSSSTEARLEEVLRQFELQTTDQIVVVTFPSLEGASLEDFSIRLAEKWKVGQKDRDNGVILLIFKEDRQLRIEVGYGLEGVLPDALAGQIITNVIVPYFRQNDYERGIVSGVQAIMQATQGEYQASPSRGNGQRQLTPAEVQALKKKMEGFFKLIFILVGVLFIIDFIRYKRYHASHQQYRGKYGFWEWWFRFAILLFIIKLIFKVIFYSLLMSRGGYHGSRSGHGGFSGGGGGFGGGGASGRW